MKRTSNILNQVLSPLLRRAGGGYLLIAFCICNLLACKKTTTSPYPSDTFLKVYSLPLAKGQGTSTTANSVYSIVSDQSGYIYTYYDDSLPGSTATYSDASSIAILKTDKYGNIVWKKHYAVFYVHGQDAYYYNFICNGQTLYLLGQDTLNNWTILKFNCSDGQLTGQIPLNGLLPTGSVAGSLYVIGMTLNNEGDFMLSSWYNVSNGFQAPMLTRLNTDGSVKWSKSDFPIPSLHPHESFENIRCITETGTGDFLVGTVLLSLPDSNASYEIATFTMNFYHFSSTGNLLSKDSLPGGASIGYQNTSFYGRFYNSDGEINSFSTFPAPQGGYIIVADENYQFSSYRLKIFKTDNSFNVLDSAFIAPPNCNLYYSGIIQKADGTIVVSVIDEALPLTNNFGYVYEVAPDLTIKKIEQIGLTSQSVVINGMNATYDGHIIMSGVIQKNGIDTNNLFILKTDNNEHF